MNPLCVIVPVYNEASAQLAVWLDALSAQLTEQDQLILVDGDSTDRTLELLCSWASAQKGREQKKHEQNNSTPLLKVVVSQKGRALQMNAGAQQARAVENDEAIFWFLHSDSGFSAAHFDYLRRLPKGRQWGRFDVSLSGQQWQFRIIETLINWRSRLTQVMTGDQGIFVRQAVFQNMQGYAEIPLMEDIEFSKRIRTQFKADCDGPILETSSRRWQKHGILKTVFLMWKLRYQYWRGVSPDKLVKEYYGS
jgi:rSAM/selenodomain-associated transferase 2